MMRGQQNVKFNRDCLLLPPVWLYEASGTDTSVWPP